MFCDQYASRGFYSYKQKKCLHLESNNHMVCYVQMVSAKVNNQRKIIFFTKKRQGGNQVKENDYQPCSTFRTLSQNTTSNSKIYSNWNLRNLFFKRKQKSIIYCRFNCDVKQPIKHFLSLFGWVFVFEDIKSFIFQFMATKNMLYTS